MTPNGNSEAILIEESEMLCRKKSAKYTLYSAAAEPLCYRPRASIFRSSWGDLLSVWYTTQ